MGTYRKLGATFAGLLVLSAFVHWLTGSSIVWWAFLAVAVTFAVLMLAGALRAGEDGRSPHA